jgi:hypothetical protein
MINISVGLSLIFIPYVRSFICDLLKDVFINSDYVIDWCEIYTNGLFGGSEEHYDSKLYGVRAQL